MCVQGPTSQPRCYLILPLYSLHVKWTGLVFLASETLGLCDPSIHLSGKVGAGIRLWNDRWAEAVRRLSVLEHYCLRNIVRISWVGFFSEARLEVFNLQKRHWVWSNVNGLDICYTRPRIVRQVVVWSKSWFDNGSRWSAGDVMV